VVRASGGLPCSGVLLAPNLAATARHCVASFTSSQVDCANSRFGALRAATEVSVTIDASITPLSALVAVREIRVPSAPEVCGNDIALLVLRQDIELPGYATPSITPPMSDHGAYGTSLAAIGYGIDLPADVAATSAGVRRIKRDIDLACVPDDDLFAGCWTDPAWQRTATPREFQGGDGPCNGDSGSGAFDQRTVDTGAPVVFGVLSRGGVNPDAGLCVGSIYTRFDRWGSLLIDTARAAAAIGGYDPPRWAAATPPPTAPSSGATAPRGCSVGGELSVGPGAWRCGLVGLAAIWFDARRRRRSHPAR
jgi:hypothetical protein